MRILEDSNLFWGQVPLVSKNARLWLRFLDTWQAGEFLAPSSEDYRS